MFITQGTIKSNVCLGFNSEDIPDEYVWNSLALARLEEFVRKLPKGLETKIGDGEKGLSGGQRQRLGIARALFTRPQLLVLDEATSALDGETESSISQAINSLKGQVSVILIAHRLSTVRSADKVIYMQDGKILASGTFEEVRKAVPDFDRQAKLMSL